MSRFKIHFVSGEKEGEIRELPEGATTLLGRSRSADLRFSALEISGKHLELTVLPSGDVVLKNLSTHRTMLNGKTLAHGETVILKAGDNVLLGEANEFILEESSEGAITSGYGAANEATRATKGVAWSQTAPRTMVASFLNPSPAASSVSSDEAKTENSEECTPRESAGEPAAVDTSMANEPAQASNDKTEIPQPIPEVKTLTQPATSSAFFRKEAVSTPPPHAVEDEEEEGQTSHIEDDDDKTEFMQTRVATMDELDLLRKTRKPKLQRWVLWLAAGLVASALFVTTSYVVSQTNIENPLTWPMEGDKFNDELIYPDIGMEKDFLLYFPRHRSMQVKKDPNRITAMTRIGKRRDVPCRVIFLMNKSVENLSLNRAKGFKAWQDKMMATGGQWNFAEDSKVYFRGREQGVPYQLARYTRSVDKEVWFGVVMYIKDRDWELILQKEIPSSERYRGEQLLVETPFMSVNQHYVMNHWEPGEVTLKMDVPEMLSEAKILLNRAIPTPRKWPYILDLLRNSMVAALRAKDMSTYSEAMDLLRDLRAKQSQWLNNQKIGYFSAQAKNLTKEAAAIRQDCLNVFSDEDDLRCHQLRNDIWD